jgi:hypothetical protein
MAAIIDSRTTKRFPCTAQGPFSCADVAANHVILVTPGLKFRAGDVGDNVGGDAEREV